MNLFVAGTGAVTPAGWDLHSLRDALGKGDPLPVRELPRPGWSRPLRVRPVPPPAARLAFLSHARLRRASPISHFAVGAALEALGSDAGLVRDGARRLGIILCVMAGCVRYSRRFYEEACRDPATASPLVFPETVFNAPASHLATLLGSTGCSYTLVGDPGMFLVGLAVAAQWLADARVEAALVVGAEEIDWLIADASRRFNRKAITSEGAGALYLTPVRSATASIELAAVTEPHSFLQHRNRSEATAAMRAELPVGGPGDLLCDSAEGRGKADEAERVAWGDWPGPRLSPKRVLGEGWAAGSAWQCVAAVDELLTGGHTSAVVSVVGCNQQAIGAVFRPALASALPSPQ